MPASGIAVSAGVSVARALVKVQSSTRPLCRSSAMKRDDFALDLVGAVVEALFQPRDDHVLVAAGLDLPHDSGCRRIEREDLLGAGLEEDAAEFLFAEFDEFC